MKCSGGPAILAVSVVFCAVSADAAFWNRKQSNDDKDKTVEPPAAYAVTPAGVSEPVRSLSSYSRESPPAQASVATPVSASVTAVKPGRRAHFVMKDQEAINTLVQLAESRRLREQEILVLSRLLVEKEGELQRMSQRLLDRFGIAADANYQYDNETKSLFLLLPRDGAEASATATADELFEKRLHRTLREKKTEVEFVRLVSAKKITASELQILKLLLKEKNLELGKVNSTLGERFAVSPEKHYEYDADSRTLFEIMPPAGGTSGGNAGP